MSKANSLAQQASDIQTRAAEFKIIATQTEYEAAVAHVKAIKALQKAIDDYHDPNIKRWHEGHKQALAQKKEAQAPLKIAENLIKGGISGYRRELDRLRQEARREAERKARAQAEAERQAEAEAAREAGNEDIAEIVEEMPVKVEVEHVPEQKFDDGVSMREHVVVEVLDKKKAVEFVLENWALMNQLVDINMKELRKLGVAQRENFQIPGCKCIIEKRPQVR